MKASFTPAASPFSPGLPQTPTARRARGKIVTYKQARDEGAVELWQQMERLIDQIDRMPDSYEVIDGFCRGTLARFDHWTKDLEKFFAALPQSGTLSRDQLRQVEMMGLERVEMTRDINLHLGAVPEVLRRYSEEYIPQAQQREDATGDPEDSLALNSTFRRKDDFVNRHMLLESARLTSVSTAMFLRQVLDTSDLAWARSHFTQAILPNLQKIRERREAGNMAAPQAEGSGDIKIRKPLRFKQPVSA